MTFFTPLPRSVTRPVSIVLVVAWVVSMAVLVKRSYIDASAANLATDLARYGSSAEWRGVYYRGEKIGFSVSQTTPSRTAGEDSPMPSCALYFQRSLPLPRSTASRTPDCAPT